MPKPKGIFRSVLLFLMVFTILMLLLYPSTRAGQCPGQFVLYAAYNHDESQLLLVTLPRTPFG